MDIHDLTRELHVKNDSKIVMLRRRRPGRPAAAAGRHDRAGNGQHAESRCARPRRRSAAAAFPCCPASPPAAGRGTSACSATIPLKYLIGRGALEATGIGFELQPGDVAIRANFCTLDADRQHHRPPRRPHRQRGERAAGRASCAQVKIPGVEVFVEPVKEHRFVIVFRGRAARWQARRPRARHRPASSRASPPLDPVAARPRERSRRPRSPRSSSSKPASCWPVSRKPTASRSAASPAKPDLPSYEEVYGLRAAAIAVYPMYKGLARLVGMDIVGKAADARRADGRARAELGEVRLLLHPLQIHRQHRRRRQLRREGRSAPKSSTPPCRGSRRCKPDVLIVTGDHSTPSMLQEPQLAPGADAAVGQQLPHRRLPDVRRSASASAAASASSRRST